jgi:DNA-binding winged helix-turn-helix (wHTH) protein/TolB-like protein/Tfp pilus assembly protein PilF
MPPPADRFAFGAFVLERSQRRLLRSDGSEVPLRPRLFNALLLFVERAGELLDKDALMRSLWPDVVVEENNLSQVVSALRRALGDDAQGGRFIRTVPRQGFRFVAVVTPLLVQGFDGAAPPVQDAPWPPVAPLTEAGTAPTRGRFFGRRRALAAAVGVGAAVGAAWWARRRQAPAELGPPLGMLTSLAVLPFKPLHEATRDAALEVGMADSLITRLSAVSGLVVRSIGSVIRYAKPSQDPLQAARELEVDWVVDGSMLRRGDQLRVSARLLRAADGQAAWSGSFDERFTSVFDVQDQISGRIANALAGSLQRTASAAEIVVLPDAGGTRSTDAYQLYLAALRRWEQGRDEALLEAIALLDRALAIDPRFANAWAAKAWAIRRRLWNADAVPAEVAEKSRGALNQALALVPGLPGARTGIGTILYFYDYDWQAAEREFRAALVSNPRLAEARYYLSLLLLTQGRRDEGFSQLRMARELEPTSPVLNTVEASFLLVDGRPAQSRARLEHSLAFAPRQWLSHVALGQLQFAEGNPVEGIASLRRAVEYGDSTTRPRGVLAMHLPQVGRADEAQTILNALLARSRERFVPPTTLAMVHAALGEREAALGALEQAFAVRDVRLIYVKDETAYRSLRSEPRFKALLLRLDLDRFGPGLSPV